MNRWTLILTATLITALACESGTYNHLNMDNDADGFTEFEGDCDDEDPATFPGAAAESPSSCMTDADQDGWGEANPRPGVTAGQDCNDNDPDLTQDDSDDDGYSTCDGDCDDSDATVFGNDLDEDGYSDCDGDCDDNDPSVFGNDIDGDGYSMCDGDCDDSDASNDPADLDDDGYSTCDGDCDDKEPTLESAD